MYRKYLLFCFKCCLSTFIPQWLVKITITQASSVLSNGHLIYFPTVFKGELKQQQNMDILVSPPSYKQKKKKINDCSYIYICTYIYEIFFFFNAVFPFISKCYFRVLATKFCLFLQLEVSFLKAH